MLMIGPITKTAYISGMSRGPQMKSGLVESVKLERTCGMSRDEVQQTVQSSCLVKGQDSQSSFLSCLPDSDGEDMQNCRLLIWIS